MHYLCETAVLVFSIQIFWYLLFIHKVVVRSHREQMLSATIRQRIFILEATTMQESLSKLMETTSTIQGSHSGCCPCLSVTITFFYYAREKEREVRGRGGKKLNSTPFLWHWIPTHKQLLIYTTINNIMLYGDANITI